MKDSATYISRFRSRWKGSIFLLMASVLLFATSARATLHSSCRLSPVPVQVNESCEVNCTFTEDVEGKQFVVLLYDESPTENVATVVDCYFIGAERECEVKNGYKFDCQSGKIQTVFIPKVDKKFEGKYVCQFLTLDEQEIEPCSLQVAEANSESDMQVHEENGVPPSAGTQRPNGNSEDSGVLVPAVVIICVLVPVLVVTLIAIFLIRSKRQRSVEKTPKTQEPTYDIQAKKRNDEGQPLQAGNSDEEGRTDSSDGSLLDGGQPNPKMRTTLNAGSADNVQHEPDMPTDRRCSSPNSACVSNHTASPKPGKKEEGGSK
ncbi:hypothetical protein BaRGS_00024569 [Batillaria attramentaria]|uniref:Uncharacterized protein n=1 Tax=Batillaria attramentaria TaxID=370345 RepID=A0ABD0KAV1_9CAEN